MLPVEDHTTFLFAGALTLSVKLVFTARAYAETKGPLRNRCVRYVRPKTPRRQSAS